MTLKALKESLPTMLHILLCTMFLCMCVLSDGVKKNKIIIKSQLHKYSTYFTVTDRGV